MNKSREYDFTLAKSAGLPVDRFPETEEEAKRAEEVFEQALEKLSLNEHETCIFDIHGITPAEEEETSMVEAKLRELELRLEKIEEKEAYNLACQMNPDYVCSRAFRLMFLRSEKFNVESSAALMVKHFDIKRMLFGDGDVLAREVRQSDLNEKDRIMLESGFCQILPTRDAAGRTIVMITSATKDQYPKDGWDDENEVSLVNVL
jgi:hypothetical protein